MKKVLHTALAAAFVLGAGAAQAQVTFGPKVGLNLANVSYELGKAAKDAGAKEPDTKMKIGAQFGIMANMRFGNLALQPAIMYSMKGYKIDETMEETETTQGFTTKTTSKFDGDLSLGYVEVPVNLVYTTGGDNGFQVFVGPYIGLGLGGKYESNFSATSTTTGNGINVTTSTSGSSKGDIKFKSEVSEDDAAKNDVDYVNTPDFGLNFGIGYMINNIQIQAGYGWGLSNLVPKYAGDTTSDDDMEKVRNRVIQVTAAYHFGGN